MDRYEGPGTIIFQNSLLVEAMNLRVQLASNNNRVRTMRKGFSGRSKGPREAEISVSNAVPQAGLEHEYLQLVVEDADVQVVIVFGGKRYQYDGYIDTVNTSQDTESPATVEYTIAAAAPKIIG